MHHVFVVIFVFAHTMYELNDALGLSVGFVDDPLQFESVIVGLHRKLLSYHSFFSYKTKEGKHLPSQFFLIPI